MCISTVFRLSYMTLSHGPGSRLRKAAYGKIAYIGPELIVFHARYAGAIGFCLIGFPTPVHHTGSWPRKASERPRAESVPLGGVHGWEAADFSLSYYFCVTLSVPVLCMQSYAAFLSRGREI